MSGALFERLAQHVDEWRAGQYAQGPAALREILQFARLDDDSLRFLRAAQFQALETYWYLRAVQGTPKVPALYEKLFPEPLERLSALGISTELFGTCGFSFDTLYDRIRTDNAFVKEHSLESLRETLDLDYASYILALTMGAGKTMLIGAIIATEFTLAQDGEAIEGGPVQNALVFAPGKTILTALRELADMPYAQILPPRLYKPFAAQLKLTFTRDGELSLPVVDGSLYNVIVTNTEKIRIQKRTGRKQDGQSLLNLGDDPDAEIANQRLRSITKLPDLAIFSDEAHHTYGQKVLGSWTTDDNGEPVLKDSGIKKIRKTVDYIAAATELRVVVNTTGTPYYKKQPLRDVIVWYGLAQGIADGILKEVGDNIQVFDLQGADADALPARVVDNFVDDYWGVRLPEDAGDQANAPARLAMYFPNTDALDAALPVVQGALTQRGLDPACALAVHSKSPDATRAAFDRIGGDASSPYRIILLVSIGKEGWNCPSLFATALMRKLTGASNNFVLQAATRCLRQIPGNEIAARIYLTADNRKILEKQLQETYGHSLADLSSTQAGTVQKTIRLRNTAVPPLTVTVMVRQYTRKATDLEPLALQAGTAKFTPAGVWSRWAVTEDDAGKVRLTRTDEQAAAAKPDTLSHYSAAAELASRTGVPTAEVMAALRAVYSGPVPEHHLPELAAQIETQRAQYAVDEVPRTVHLALIKPAGFNVAEDRATYTANIALSAKSAALYKRPADYQPSTLAEARSFHYSGYNFDSAPEADFLQRVLSELKRHPEHIAGVWFTGGITDPAKTDLYAEYEAADGRWRHYSPDFLLQRADGKQMIVEIKSSQHRTAIESDLKAAADGQAPQHAEGSKAVAVKRWEQLNPEHLAFAVLFATDSEVPMDQLDAIKAFARGDWPVTTDG